MLGDNIELMFTFFKGMVRWEKILILFLEKFLFLEGIIVKVIL